MKWYKWTERLKVTGPDTMIYFLSDGKRNKDYSDRVNVYQRIYPKYYEILGTVDTTAISTFHESIEVSEEEINDFLITIGYSLPLSKKKCNMNGNNKVVVYTEGNPEKNNVVISYARNGELLYETKAQYIDLEDGCHCTKQYFIENNYTIISYEDFVRDYLNKSIYYECY